MKKILLPLSVSLLLLGAGCGSSTPSTTNTPSSSSTTFTLSQVAQHNSANDCWLIINGGVYNATSYLPQHPGGPAQITPFCGQDASQAFATQGGRGKHSGQANADLAQLKIGTVSQ